VKSIQHCAISVRGSKKRQGLGVQLKRIQPRILLDLRNYQGDHGARLASFRMKVKTSDLLVATLINEGVDIIFGIPGEENLDLVEALRKQDKIKLVLVRHEQAAGFMAATVGRLTGKVGVALSTLGPGNTNFTTSMAFAFLGGFSCMFLTGQKGIKDTKQGEFQILDNVSINHPITKYAKQCTNGNLIASMVRRAFREAMTEKPGPVHIELPEDIASEMTDFRLFDPSPVRRPVTDEKGILRAVDALKNAKRPVVVIGAGANRQRAVGALNEFVNELGIHFIATQMGKGIITELSEYFLGCAALSQKDYIHIAFDMSDCIVMLGADSSEKPPFLQSNFNPDKGRTVIHINYTTAHVDNVYFPQIEVIGDVANAVWQIKEKLHEAGKKFKVPVFQRLKSYIDVAMKDGMDDDAFPMNIARVVAEIRSALPEDGILSLDNGFYKIWFARLFRAVGGPNTVLLDNALATMGAGLPNAIGTKFIFPNRPVLSVSGDGGYLMNCPELATAVQYGLNITNIVLNDNAFGMIKWKQNNMDFDDWGLDLRNPNFVKHAESYGAKGYRLEKIEDLPKILKECLRSQGVKVVEIPISYDWATQKLKDVQKEAQDILQRIKNEYGEEIIGEDSYPEPETPTSSDPAPEKMKKALDSVTPSSGRNLNLEEPETAKPSVSEPKTSPPPPSVPRPNPSPPPPKTRSKGDYSFKEGMELPFYLNGAPVYANADLEVMDKYTGKVFCKVALANKADIENAIQNVSTTGFAKMRNLPHYMRKEILKNIVEQVKARREEFAMMLCIEAGKPIKDSRGEVDRLIQTFDIAAEEAVRIYGEYADLDIAQRGVGYTSVTKKFPIGPVSMVSPFNFPLNLTAHKVAPAIAAGCSFVLKPASKTPLGALLLGEILAADPRMPKEAFSILPCSRDAGNALTEDDRFKLLSFTGSPDVGWNLKTRSGKKGVVLELGGNAACVVDSLMEDMDSVIDMVIHGAFYQSGQSCISVQRLYVHEKFYEEFKTKFVEKVSKLRKGDPKEEETFIGPVISENDASRIVEWIQEAVEGGAKLLCGGEKEDRIVSAAVVEHVPRNCKLYTEELFGPGVCLEQFSDFKQVVAEVNNSRFGLQAGVFTTDFNKAHYAFENIEAGGVVINAVPSVRIDSQAYGGVKDSGFGREGVRYAIEDMTEIKIMLMRNAGKLDA